MKKVLTIILCVLLTGTLALDAMAFRGPAANECAKASCCCTPSISKTPTHAALSCSLGEVAPGAHVRATCCHPSPAGPSTMDFVLVTAPPTPAPLPQAGLVSAIGHCAINDQLTGVHRQFSENASPLSTGIPLFLLTLSIRC